MVMKLVKYIGRPFCIILYIYGIVMACRKKFIPLCALVITHLTEFNIVGDEIAEEKSLSKKEVFIKCLAFGFTWWLPLKKEKEEIGETE